jgi:hypothetical protein
MANSILILLFCIILTFIVVKIWRKMLPARSYELTDDEPLLNSEDLID